MRTHSRLALFNSTSIVFREWYYKLPRSKARAGNIDDAFDALNWLADLMPLREMRDEYSSAISRTILYFVAK